MWTTRNNSSTTYSSTTASTTGLCVGRVGHMVNLLCNMRRRKAGSNKGHSDSTRVWRSSVLRRGHQGPGLQYRRLLFMLVRQSEQKINLVCFWSFWRARAFPNDVHTRTLSHLGSQFWLSFQLQTTTGPGIRYNVRTTQILLSRTQPGSSRSV